MRSFLVVIISILFNTFYIANATDSQVKCAEGEEFKRSGADAHCEKDSAPTYFIDPGPGCFCISGWARSFEDRCVPLSQCPGGSDSPPPQLEMSPGSGQGQVPPYSQDVGFPHMPDPASQQQPPPMPAHTPPFQSFPPLQGQLIRETSHIIHVPPQMTQGPPQVIQGQPQMIQGAPQMIQGPPQMIQGPPQMIQGPPQMIQGQPQMIQGPPQMMQGQTMMQGPPPPLMELPQLPQLAVPSLAQAPAQGLFDSMFNPPPGFARPPPFAG